MQRRQRVCNTLLHATQLQHTTATHYCNTLLQITIATHYCNTPLQHTILQHTTATHYCPNTQYSLQPRALTNRIQEVQHTTATHNYNTPLSKHTVQTIDVRTHEPHAMSHVTLIQMRHVTYLNSTIVTANRHDTQDYGVATVSRID